MSIQSEFRKAMRCAGVSPAKIEGDDVSVVHPMTGYREFEGEPNAVHLSIVFKSLNEKKMDEIRALGDELLKKNISPGLGSVHAYGVGKSKNSFVADGYIYATVAVAEGASINDLMDKMHVLYERMTKGDFGQPLSLSGRFMQWVRKARNCEATNSRQ